MESEVESLCVGMLCVGMLSMGMRSPGRLPVGIASTALTRAATCVCVLNTEVVHGASAWRPSCCVFPYGVSKFANPGSGVTGEGS